MGKPKLLRVFHSKDKSSNIWAAGTEAVLKSSSLSSLKNYLVSVYYGI